MLLQCQHPTIHGLVTKRHDKAVHEVAKAIERGKKGGEVLLVNAKRGEGGKSAQRTVPDWMLSRGARGGYVSVEESEDGVVHNKPDIVLVEGLDENEEAGVREKKRCTVHVVEVGYCWDHEWRSKKQAKERTYEKLAEALLGAGWRDVRVHAVPIGATGLMGEEVREVWKELGVEGTGVDKLYRRIMDVTWEALVGLIRARYAALHEVRRAADGEVGRQWDVG